MSTNTYTVRVELCWEAELHQLYSGKTPNKVTTKKVAKLIAKEIEYGGVGGWIDLWRLGNLANVTVNGTGVPVR